MITTLDNLNFSRLEDRIKYVKEIKQITSAKIAELGGVKQSSVFNWEKGVTKTMKPDVANKLGGALNINPIWLSTGVGNLSRTEFVVAKDDKEQPTEGTVLVRESKVIFSCGDGRLPYFEEMSDGTPATYRLAWFQRRQVNPAHCIRFQITGDSMSPFINNGDMVLVNTLDTKPRSGHVYAIVLDDELKVKRLITKANGGLIIRSDNSAYPDDVINPNDDVYIKIMGRVIDRSGDNGL